MKLAITGASGFIGKYLVAEALAQGYSATAITRQAADTFWSQLLSSLADPQGLNAKALEVKQCDLNSESALTEALGDCDTLIHLAASMQGSNQYQETIDTSKHLIAAIKRSQIKTLMLVSSISVLDYVSQAPLTLIDEKTPLCNRDEDLGEYARMKRDQEKLCQQWHIETGKQFIIVRPGLVYSDENLSDAHAGFIKKGGGLAALHKGEVPLIKVSEVAKQIIALFGHSLFSKDIFHLIGKPAVSQSDYLEQLKQQGALRFYLPIPWQAYNSLAQLIRWALTKANKADKIPDSFYNNSVAARQKPFRFSSEKIDRLD